MPLAVVECLVVEYEARAHLKQASLVSGLRRPCICDEPSAAAGSKVLQALKSTEGEVVGKEALCYRLRCMQQVGGIAVKVGAVRCSPAE